MKKKKIGYLLLFIVGWISSISLIVYSPIEQDPTYHFFCNDLCKAGVSNFWNVISNLPFLIVGLYGLLTQFKKKHFRPNYIIFFIGVALVSLGSGYYHLNPTNDTLIWDRLPMTLSFTAFISIVVTNFIDRKTGEKLLLPLITFGLISVFYWVFTDNLSLYIFIQFYPIIAIPIILLFFDNTNHSKKGYWFLLLAYLFAKILETYDHEVHHILHFVSGHPLKHLVAATGIFLFIIYSPHQTKIR